MLANISATSACTLHITGRSRWHQTKLLRELALDSLTQL